MTDTHTPDAPTDAAPSGQQGGQEGKEPEQTFTQADVDRIVRERVKREREKFADYDDLKEKAGEKATLDERVAQLEQQARDAETRAMRAEVANAKGLNEAQAKRLMGSTREELEADADELLAVIGAQKKNGNHVPTEGKNPKSGKGNDELRAFAGELFGRARAE